MTHVSRKKLERNKEKELISALKEVFTGLKKYEVDKIFSDLITETEEVMLAKRLAVVVMLSENAPYEDISASLNLTNQTISRIHAEVNYRKDVYQFLIRRLAPWKRKELLKAILKDLGLRSAKLIAKHAGGRIY